MKDNKVEDKKMIKVTGGKLNVFDSLKTSPAPIYVVCKYCKVLVKTNIDGTCSLCNRFVDFD